MHLLPRRCVYDIERIGRVYVLAADEERDCVAPFAVHGTVRTVHGGNDDLLDSLCHIFAVGSRSGSVVDEDVYGK